MGETFRFAMLWDVAASDTPAPLPDGAWRPRSGEGSSPCIQARNRASTLSPSGTSGGIVRPSSGVSEQGRRATGTRVRSGAGDQSKPAPRAEDPPLPARLGVGGLAAVGGAKLAVDDRAAVRTVSDGRVASPMVHVVARVGSVELRAHARDSLEGRTTDCGLRGMNRPPRARTCTAACRYGRSTVSRAGLMRSWRVTSRYQKEKAPSVQHCTWPDRRRVA